MTVMQPDKNTITGSAIIEAKGGTPPYRIEWDNGEKGAAAKELVPGNHLVTITDTLGCKTEVEVLIVKSKIYASAIATDNNCAGACKGSISIVIENEDGTERYVWSDGGSGKERSGLCAGEYTCTINDEYGNETILMDIVIDAPDQLKLLLGTVGESCPDKGDGKAWVDISGGTPGYTIYWDEKEGGDSVELKPGIHTLRIEDKNGCRTDSTLFIAARTAVEWEIKAEDILCEKKGKIMVSAATNELQTIGVNGQVYSFAGTLEVLISEPGKYALENYISDSCIIEKGELEIKELEWISGGQTGGRIVVKEGEFVSLDVSGLKIEGAYEMEWKGLPLVDCSEEDELGNCVRYEYKAEGPHNVAVEIKSKEGCDTVIRFDIVVILDNEVFLPNVFGSNDPMNFKPTDKHGNTYIDMFIIYDRWGNKVFTENEKEINQMLGWDGNLNGKRVESDVYMYMLSTIDNKGKKKLYSGDVTLIK